MSMVQVMVDMEDISDIEDALGMAKSKSKMILRNAINKSVKQTEKDMVERARKRYRYKNGAKGNIKEANKIKKAKAGNMEAVIEARGPTNELLKFRVRPNTYFPGGVGAPRMIKVNVLREKGYKKLVLKPGSGGDQYKAFVTRFKNGHYAVAQRVPGKRMKSKPAKEAIQSLMSVSVPKMEETVYSQEMSEEIYDTLKQNIWQQIDRVLGKEVFYDSVSPSE